MSKVEYFKFGFWIDDDMIKKLNKTGKLTFHSIYQKEDVTFTLMKQ